MNIGRILKYIGTLLMLEALFMLFPFVCGLIYKETNAQYFLSIAIMVFLIGLFLNKIFIADNRFFIAEGFVTASIGWMVMSFFGALPLYLSGEIPSFVDAIFETVSGFTTTGATILTDVEGLSKCMNFWRCFTHFVGGMGVVVLMIAIIPTKSENLFIMKAESPGPQVGKLAPKVSDTAKILYVIYLALTVIMIVCYLISGMPLYDAICIGLGTAGTGGFVVTNVGCAGYGAVSQTLIAIFMLIFGVNFNIYYYILLKKYKDVINSEELRVYVIIVLITVILIVINTFKIYSGVYDAIHNVFFTVSSIITTTGFSITNHNEWPLFSHFVLMFLMLLGGCAGSTAGGYKISRLVMIVKTTCSEMYFQLHPNSVKIVKFEEKRVSESLLKSVHSYTMFYIFFIVLGLFLISFENCDLMTTVTTVFQAFNNVGLGIGKIGFGGNFAFYSNFSKIVLTILMLTGRLEIFPMIMLFSMKTWRREK